MASKKINLRGLILIANSSYNYMYAFYFPGRAKGTGAISTRAMGAPVMTSCHPSVTQHLIANSISECVNANI